MTDAQKIPTHGELETLCKAEKCKCKCHSIELYVHPILGNQYFCSCDYPHSKEPDLMCNNCRIKAVRQRNKLLEFVKECSQNEKYLNELCKKQAINFNDDISMKATNLLKEIGEL